MFWKINLKQSLRQELFWPQIFQHWYRKTKENMGGLHDLSSSLGINLCGE